MNVQTIPFHRLHLLGGFTSILGLITIAYSVRWLQLDPDPDWKMLLLILFLSMAGALLFQMGIGFGMAWIMVRRTDSVTAMDVSEFTRDRTCARTLPEKDEPVDMQGVYAPRVGEIMAYESQIRVTSLLSSQA